MKALEQLARPNIWRLKPYSCARNEYSGRSATTFLDANENPYNAPYNRYPDPLQAELKAAVAKVKGVPAENIFIGNGSDEAIDLAYRCFTRPGADNVVAIAPTYGMYKVCADINDVEYRAVNLDEGFRLNAEKTLSACDENTKLLWLCSPNNPTGNSLDRSEVETILDLFDGIVIIDEAYSDFSKAKTFRHDIAKRPNLIVLNTMSKAWGCAALRLGMAFADKAIVGLFNKVKYPYNINLLTQQLALKALQDPFQVDKWVKTILLERERMADAFGLLPICKKVYPSEANFLLVEMADANAVYDYLIGKGIVVRNRSSVTLCGNCLRITIGSKSENNELLSALRQYGG